MIKAIIFDFDGVLVESVDVKTKAFAKLFENYGPEVVQQVVEHHLINGGMSRFEKIKHYYSKFLCEPLSQGGLDMLCDRFSEMVVEQVVNAPWVKGAQSFLESNNKKFLMFIISGTPQKELRDIAQKRNMESYFKDILGSPDNKITLTSKVLDKYNFHRKDVVFIGDAMTDYNAAMETGINFVGRVASGATNPFPKETIMISDLTQLEKTIHKI